MINRIARGGVLIALLLSFIFNLPVGAASTYTDPQGRFSFTLPDGYTPVQTQLTAPFIAGFVAPNTANANFTIQVRDASGSLDAATAEQQKRYATGPDSQPGSGGIQSLTLGGKPAQQFDYFTNAQGSRFHVALILCINGSALYIVTFTAQEQDYDALINQTNLVLSSFAFLTNGATATTSEASDGTAVYSDPQGRFSFVVPIDFQLSRDPVDAAVEFDALSANESLATYFYIAVDTILSLPNQPFNAIVTDSRNYLVGERNYTVVSEQAVTLAGQPAYRFDVTKTATDGRPVRSAFVIATRGTSFLQITYVSSPSAWDRFSGRLQSLLSSFSFSATPNAITPPSGPAPAPVAPPKVPGLPAAPPSNPPASPPSAPASSPVAPPSTDHDGR